MSDPTQLQDDLPLTAAHRAVRALAPGEGPYRGTLVVDGDAVRVWTTDADAADGRFLGAEHVCGPVGFARGPSGSGALLPWCTVALGSFLARRSAAGEPLAAGEWVTVLASMVRGMQEAAERGARGLAGTWWLTEEGRPVLVPGSGHGAEQALRDTLERVISEAADRALQRLAQGMHDALRDGDVSAGRAERWVAELCAFAAPQPLRMQVHAPERALDVSAVHRGAQGRAQGALSERVPVRRVRERRGIRVLLTARARGAAAGLRALRERALRTRPRVPRAPRPVARQVDAAARERRPSDGRRAPRGRVLAVGAVVAAIVVVGGVLWPETDAADAEGAMAGAGESSAGESSTGESSTGPQPTGTEAAPPGDGPAPGAGEGAPEPGEQGSGAPESAERPGDGARAEPLEAVAGLLTTLSECAAEQNAECVALAEGSRVEPAGVLQVASESGASLVDDYGDIAVIRLTADGAEQMLVLIRQNGKWLVRDAYDVADQP